MKIKRIAAFLLFWGLFLAGFVWLLRIADDYYLKKVESAFAARGASAYDFQAEDFSLLDHQGKYHQLSYYASSNAIVLILHASDCPQLDRLVPDLNQLQRRYDKKDVQFFMLNGIDGQNRTEIADYARRFGLQIPVLKDETGLVTESLDAHTVPEVLLIEPKTRKIAYRGPLQEWDPEEKVQYSQLEWSLETLLKGKALNLQISGMKGCPIPESADFFTTENGISYAEDIAPILKNKCMSCHIPGGMAPWPMDSYETVRSWSPMMREVIMTNRMPPWHADPLVGDFSNDRSLSTEEKRKLVHWIRSGAPRGKGADPLPRWASEELPRWPYGTPDLIIPVPRQQIPATGPLEYRFIEVNFPEQKDRWIRTSYLNPGNRRAMHHTVVYRKGKSRFMTQPQPVEQPGRPKGNTVFDVDYIGAYLPGHRSLPRELGALIPKSSKLIFEIHYVATGKPETDDSEMGLYFYPDDIVPAHRNMISIRNESFRIPPRARSFHVQARGFFAEDVKIYSFFPHMHYRGKSFKVTAVYPGGEQEVLLSVPDYDFNWQTLYELREAKSVPAGTEIVCDAIYDNSAQNAQNPDPHRWVSEGDLTTQEMMHCYIGYSSVEHSPGT